MPHTVVIHLLNEEPLIAETDNMPEPTDQVFIVSNVRRTDGREVSYLLPEAGAVVFPWTRIQCVEVVSSESDEEIITFIRE